MKSEKKSITAIIFYVFAVLFLAYTTFSIFTAYTYVADYVSQGAISYGTDFKDIIALYMQQAGPYLVYSLLLYGIGYIIDMMTKIKGSVDGSPVHVEEVITPTVKASVSNAKKEKIVEPVTVATEETKAEEKTTKEKKTDKPAAKKEETK